MEEALPPVAYAAPTSQSTMIPVPEPSSATAILAQLTSLRREVATMASQQTELTAQLAELRNVFMETRAFMREQVGLVLYEMRELKGAVGSQSGWQGSLLPSASGLFSASCVPATLSAATTLGKGGLGPSGESGIGTPLTNGGYGIMSQDLGPATPMPAIPLTAGVDAPAMLAEEEEEIFELQLTGKPAVDGKLQELILPDCHVATLSFSGTKLGPEGAQAVASVLKINTSLREVNLSHCAIGGRGGMALAQSLTQNPYIKKLALPGNSLGAEGGTALALMLKYNTGLEAVNLLYNGLGSHVGATLVDALLANKTLKKLQVMYDGLSTEGGGALAEVLAHNASLEELEVGGSREDLTPEGRAKLDAALENNPTIRKLKFFDDPSVYYARK